MARLDKFTCTSMFQDSLTINRASITFQILHNTEDDPPCKLLRYTHKYFIYFIMQVCNYNGNTMYNLIEG